MLILTHSSHYSSRRRQQIRLAPLPCVVDTQPELMSSLRALPLSSSTQCHLAVAHNVTSAYER